ncbi:MAG: hypothetical protein F6J92_36675, partial [Symploca sp. SIO1A3]|nr:hypothetical protein [Symploca sp. SIO1A3]
MTKPHELENDRSLKTLVRSLTRSQGKFSLILVRCNYTGLRDRILQQVREQCRMEVGELALLPSAETLYTTIVQDFGEQPTEAVMVLGLESVVALDDLLGATNKVRDQFRSLAFPVVLWVTDRVFRQLVRVAPDFKSWAGSPLQFMLSDEELVGLVRQQAEQAFAEEPSFTVEGDEWIRETTQQTRRRGDTETRRIAISPKISFTHDELEAVEQDLHSRRQELEPELKASLAFIRGLIYDRDNQLDVALEHYQQSLALYPPLNSLPGGEVLDTEKSKLYQQGIVLLHIGLVYYHKGEQYWSESRNYLEQCLDKFEEAQRRDLVAKHISKLGKVLRGLQDWEALQNLAEKALELHQNHGLPRQLAEDYGFLAEVALKNEQWQEANQWAKQALEVREGRKQNPPLTPRRRGTGGRREYLTLSEREQGVTQREQDARTTTTNLPKLDAPDCALYHLILAKSQQKLGEKQDAISNLEQARDKTQPHEELSLYFEILTELRSLYFEQGQYLEAFHLKLEQREVESQYGLRAFVGAGRLQPPVFRRGEAGKRRREDWKIVEDIVAASGRQQDVERLIERVKRPDCKLTVIYGQSGVGKSSILQAGLVPALEVTSFEGREAVPVVVDVYTDWVGELGKRLLDEPGCRGGFSQSISDSTDNLSAKPALSESPDLPTILEQLQQNEQRHRLTVLIFDQFEEFFFVYKDQASRRPFYEFLRQCLEIPYVKILLSLREDYIQYLLELSRTTNLQGFDDDYKNILYYLGNFSPADAKSVIENLTERSQFYLDPEFLDKLVTDLAGEVGEVRPIELQIVGTQLQKQKITTLKQYQQLGTEDRLVEQFLEDVVRDCGKENKDTAQLILYLLTDENNARPLKNKAELAADLAV